MYDIIGYVSIIFSIMAFVTKDKFQMRLQGGIATLLFGISIYSYGGINGAFVSIVSFLVKILSLKFDEDKLKFIKILSFPLSLIFFLVFNEEGVYGLLPALSLIFIVFADLQKDILKMKYIYFGSAICWLVYAIIINSVPAILFDVFGLTALTYSVYQIKTSRK